MGTLLYSTVPSIFKVYSVLCIVYSAQFAVYSVQCTICSVQCTICSVQCTVYSVPCTVYSLQCTAYSVQCTVYSVQCTLYTVKCTVYSLHVGTVNSTTPPQCSAVQRCTHYSSLPPKAPLVMLKLLPPIFLFLLVQYLSVFFLKHFFDRFSTPCNVLTVRDPPYGEKFENISKCCF